MTIPELFQESVKRFSGHPALAWKGRRKWNTLSFAQYYTACRTAGRALLKVHGPLVLVCSGRAPHTHKCTRTGGTRQTPEHTNIYWWKSPL